MKSPLPTVHRRYLRWIFSLLMILGLLSTPLTTIAAPVIEPEQGDNSIHLPLTLKHDCDGTISSANQFGTQLYTTNVRSEPYFAHLQNLRLGWVRNSVTWPSVEPTNLAPSKYKWGVPDAVIRNATDTCSNMLATIDLTAPWATTGDSRSPFQTQYLNEYVQFVTAVVERYDGDGVSDAAGHPVVNYWEFYNEPDAGPTAGGGAWGEDGARYAEMLKAVYPAVQAANPNAKVVLGGLAYDMFSVFVREFLDTVLDAGGGGFFDYVNLHYYPFHGHRVTWTSNKSTGLLEKIASINATLVDHNLSKPLMLTEIGWHSNSPTRNPSSEEFQARTALALTAQALSAGAEAIIWWPFEDIDTYDFSSGLVTSAATTKLGYKSYAEAMRRLGGAGNTVEQVLAPTDTNDIEIHSSHEPNTNKTQYVAWLNLVVPFSIVELDIYEENAALPWQFDGGKATVYDKVGALVGIVHDGDDGFPDGKVTISIGHSPIYVVMD